MEAAQVVEEMGNDSGGGDEFFYEEIEAPKYVDFTAPDHYNPDDRYWFCSRVGCDQKHEEELDLEEINKNFVLRVMAARSPNVRLRKALTARRMDSARKCPLTAPPKPSRTRVSRLAVLSSISRKLMDGKERVKPVRPLTVTPNPKGKNPTVVALTTPRYKKKVLKPEVFRSVRNPKKEEGAVSEENTRVVAKALLFHSPKKLVKKKTASDMDASVRKICTGMKKLEINGQRKNILGYDNKSLNTGASKKKLGAREVKSRVYDILKSQKCKNPQENGASKFMEKEECEKELQKSVTSEGCDGSSGESSDVEVDENSNRGSLENCSTESELFEVPIVQDALDDLRNKLTIQVEMLLPSSDSNSSGPSENPLSTKEKDDNVETVKSVAEEDGSPKGDNLDDNTGDRENSELEGDDKENASIVNYNRDQNAVSENDDKENTSALDDNRQRNREPSGNILGKQDKHGKKQLKARVISKPSQEAGVDTKSGQVGKYTKPKPTNPKPFRLRTDERRVLKEANLEKKLLEPSKAANPTAFPGLSGGNPPKKHHHIIKNESLTSQSKEGSGHQRDEMKRREGTFILQQRRIPILSPQTPTQETMKRKKLPLKGQSQRIVPSKRPKIRQLSAIKETSKLEDRPKETPKLNEVKAKAVNSPIASGESRSLSRSRRRPTIPKEPNFHSVHVPRSCTSKLVGAN